MKLRFDSDTVTLYIELNIPTTKQTTEYGNVIISDKSDKEIKKAISEVVRDAKSQLTVIENWLDSLADNGHKSILEKMDN